MVKYEFHSCMCLWEHAWFSVCGDKSTEIKTSNHFVRPLQLRLREKNKTNTQYHFKTGVKRQNAAFKEQINCSQFTMANLGPHSTWHPSSGNQNELPTLLSTKQPTPNCFSFLFYAFFASYPAVPQPLSSCCVYEERDRASHRMLINWSPVDNGEEVCGHDSESFRWNGRCLITAAVSAVE